MARPTKIERHLADEVRKKIRGTWLVNRLQKHVEGELPLTISQVQAINILLKKIVPDLTRTEVKGEVTHRWCVEVPPLLSKEEWQNKYRISPQTPAMPELEAPTIQWHGALDSTRRNGHS